MCTFWGSLQGWLHALEHLGACPNSKHHLRVANTNKMFLDDC